MHCFKKLNYEALAFTAHAVHHRSGRTSGDFFKSGKSPVVAVQNHPDYLSLPLSIPFVFM